MKTDGALNSCEVIVCRSLSSIPYNGDAMAVTGVKITVGEGRVVCVRVGVAVTEGVKVGVSATILDTADDEIVGVGAGAQAASNATRHKTGSTSTKRADCIVMVDR
jgi:hypothetical protein